MCVKVFGTSKFSTNLQAASKFFMICVWEPLPEITGITIVSYNGNEAKKSILFFQ